MRYYQIKPSLQLSDLVRYFWVSEVDQHFTYYATAASSARLVFHYAGRFDEITASGQLIPSYSSGMQGQSQTPAQFITQESVQMFGVEFFPHAIPSLFSMPGAALTDQYIDLHTFLGNRGSELEEQIFIARTTEERVTIVSRFLGSLITNNGKPYIIDAINRINKAGGMLNITHLAKNAPVSQRQFERSFKEVAGFTPKLYARIKRFETTLNKSGSLTEIALDAGYFDQAHFIRDFKAFTGLQPKNYFKATAGLPDVENVQF